MTERPRPERRWRLGGGLIAVAGLLSLGFLMAPDPVPPLPESRALHPLPASGPVRIVVMGTSLSARTPWPQELAQRLSACAGREVTVVPVAQGGKGSNWGRDQVDRVVDLAPDLVLIEFSINDSDLRHGVSLAAAHANHEAILDRLALARPGGQVALVIMSPAFGPRGWMRFWRSNHEAQYRHMAAERDLGLIDLAPLWQAALSTAPTGRRSLMPDGLHPTAKAVSDVALPELLRQIETVLPECAPRSGGS